MVPRKAEKRRVTKESSRDGIACSMSHFSVFSQVVNLGCIEFLNRGSGVRFTPRARDLPAETPPRADSRGAFLASLWRQSRYEQLANLAPAHRLAVQQLGVEAADLSQR
jgi:hypothetical protein